MKKLVEALRSGIAADRLAIRLALYQFFNANHDSCLLGARARALIQVETKAVR